MRGGVPFLHYTSYIPASTGDAYNIKGIESLPESVTSNTPFRLFTFRLRKTIKIGIKISKNDVEHTTCSNHIQAYTGYRTLPALCYTRSCVISYHDVFLRICT